MRGGGAPAVEGVDVNWLENPRLGNALGGARGRGLTSPPVRQDGEQLVGNGSDSRGEVEDGDGGLTKRIVLDFKSCVLLGGQCN